VVPGTWEPAILVTTDSREAADCARRINDIYMPWCVVHRDGRLVALPGLIEGALAVFETRVEAERWAGGTART
jgi:hypothetical protein